MIYLISIMSAYGAFELFIMAQKSIKERRFWVLMQIGAGFSLSLWALIDKTMNTMPVFLGLLYLVSDRLQTRIMNKKRVTG